MAARSSGPLAILRLQHKPVPMKGSIADPASFAYDVRYLAVPGAWTENVTGGDRAVLTSYIESARRMVAEGCRAITTTCGFTSLFQAEVSAAVAVPVALSSLSLLPLLERLTPPGGRIAVITFDATRLTEAHCQGAGWSLAASPVAVAGIEGSESWQEMFKPKPGFTREMLARDVLAAIARLRAAHGDICAILLECAFFPIVADEVRAKSKLPVVDFLTVGDLLMAASEGVPAAARAAAE
jgi:hypothetical protein